jgi:hypothetical protein
MSFNENAYKNNPPDFAEVASAIMKGFSQAVKTKMIRFLQALQCLYDWVSMSTRMIGITEAAGLGNFMRVFFGSF